MDGRSSDDELDELLDEMDSSLEISTTSDEHEEVECIKNVESSNEELYSSRSTYDQQQDKDQNQSAAFDSPWPVIVLYSSSSEEDV